MRNTISKLLVPVQFIFLGMYLGSIVETSPRISSMALIWLALNIFCWGMRAILTGGDVKIYTSEEYQNKK